MKLKLSVSGGLVPIHKEAEIEAPLSDKELVELLAAIEIKSGSPTRARDAKSYTLEANGKTVQIDPNLVPEHYKELFNQLINNLKRVSL
jgi:hypothetical protein